MSSLMVDLFLCLDPQIEKLTKSLEKEKETAAAAAEEAQKLQESLNQQLQQLNNDVGHNDSVVFFKVTISHFLAHPYFFPD